MGMGDMIDKAKQAVGGDANADKAVDQVADAAKEKAPDQGDAVIDQAAAAVILQSALDMREVRGDDVGEPVDPATRGSDD